MTFDGDIRRLHAADATVWRAIRIEAVRADPQAFAWKPEDVEAMALGQFSAQLDNSWIYVAETEDEPVACLGWYSYRSAIMAHRANLFGTYVRSGLRGQGVTDALFARVQEEAPAAITQFELEVATDNLAAVALYQRWGFQISGTLPNAVMLPDGPRDDYLMIRARA